MPAAAFFLRAVNVGGHGRLSMADLREAALRAGLTTPETIQAAGTLIAGHDGPPSEAASALAQALSPTLGTPPVVVHRTAAALAVLLDRLPFADAPGARVGILLLPAMASEADLAARHLADEEVTPLGDAIAIHYPSGMGQSRLALGGLDRGTVRNRNTLEKTLARLSARERSGDAA